MSTSWPLPFYCCLSWPRHHPPPSSPRPRPGAAAASAAVRAGPRVGPAAPLAPGGWPMARAVGRLIARRVGAGLLVRVELGGLFGLQDRPAVAEVPAVVHKAGWRVGLR